MGLINYIKETRTELKHVSWPTRRQAIAFTLIVIAISLGTAIFLGFFDFIFSKGIQYVIAHFG
jgi:preprotein translocase subunit SecE